MFYSILTVLIADGIYPPLPTAKSFLQEVYKEAGIDPAQVGYMEGNGTCNLEADSHELTALADVLCDSQRRTSPLLVGSVKANIGHTEAASGTLKYLYGI